MRGVRGGGGGRNRAAAEAFSHGDGGAHHPCTEPAAWKWGRGGGSWQGVGLHSTGCVCAISDIMSVPDAAAPQSLLPHRAALFLYHHLLPGLEGTFCSCHPYSRGRWTPPASRSVWPARLPFRPLEVSPPWGHLP